MFTSIKYQALRFCTQFFPQQRVPDVKDTGIITLLTHAHIPQYECAVQSFFLAVGNSLPLYIYDDGTLTNADRLYLSKKYRVAFDSEDVSKPDVIRQLKKYPHTRSMLENGNHPVLLHKIEMLFRTPFARSIILDSDVIFFNQSPEIRKWIEKKQTTTLYLQYARHENHTNWGYLYEYSLRNLISSALYLPIDEFFNSGLVCIGESSLIRKNIIELFCKMGNRAKLHRLWSIDELLIATLAAHSAKSKPLPIRMYIAPTDERDYQLSIRNQGTCIHYTYGTKPHLFKDCILLALHKNFFRPTRE